MSINAMSPSAGWGSSVSPEFGTLMNKTLADTAAIDRYLDSLQNQPPAVAPVQQLQPPAIPKAVKAEEKQEGGLGGFFKGIVSGLGKGLNKIIQPIKDNPILAIGAALVVGAAFVALAPVTIPASIAVVGGMSAATVLGGALTIAGTIPIAMNVAAAVPELLNGNTYAAGEMLGEAGFDSVVNFGPLVAGKFMGKGAQAVSLLDETTDATRAAGAVDEAAQVANKIAAVTDDGVNLAKAEATITKADKPVQVVVDAKKVTAHPIGTDGNPEAHLKGLGKVKKADLNPDSLVQVVQVNGRTIRFDKPVPAKNLQQALKAKGVVDMPTDVFPFPINGQPVDEVVLAANAANLTDDVLKVPNIQIEVNTKGNATYRDLVTGETFDTLDDVPQHAKFTQVKKPGTKNSTKTLEQALSKDEVATLITPDKNTAASQLNALDDAAKAKTVPNSPTKPLTPSEQALQRARAKQAGAIEETLSPIYQKRLAETQLRQLKQVADRAKALGNLSEKTAKQVSIALEEAAKLDDPVKAMEHLAKNPVIVRLKLADDAVANLNILRGKLDPSSPEFKALDNLIEQFGKVDANNIDKLLRTYQNFLVKGKLTFGANDVQFGAIADDIVKIRGSHWAGSQRVTAGDVQELAFFRNGGPLTKQGRQHLADDGRILGALYKAGVNGEREALKELGAWQYARANFIKQPNMGWGAIGDIAQGVRGNYVVANYYEATGNLANSLTTPGGNYQADMNAAVNMLIDALVAQGIPEDQVIDSLLLQPDQFALYMAQVGMEIEANNYNAQMALLIRKNGGNYNAAKAEWATLATANMPQGVQMQSVMAQSPYGQQPQGAYAQQAYPGAYDPWKQLNDNLNFNSQYYTGQAGAPIQPTAFNPAAQPAGAYPGQQALNYQS